jgi:hypothetical protein
VLKAQLALKAFKEQQAYKELQELKAFKAFKAQQEPQELQAFKAQQEQQAPRVNRARILIIWQKHPTPLTLLPLNTLNGTMSIKHLLLNCMFQRLILTTITKQIH